MSFGVGRLVGSPVSRSPRRSPSHSPCPDSPILENQDPDIEIDCEDEEIDVDVEEVEDYEDQEGTSSPPRSSSPPSPIPIIASKLSSNPPKRYVSNICTFLPQRIGNNHL